MLVDARGLVDPRAGEHLLEAGDVLDQRVAAGDGRGRVAVDGVVGPRFFEQLAAELPAYWQRLVIRPGLTGFAQVRRGYETSMAEKLAHDLEWIADRSVPLYLRTLTSTAIRIAGQSVRGLVRSDH